VVPAPVSPAPAGHVAATSLLLRPRLAARAGLLAQSTSSHLLRRSPTQAIHVRGHILATQSTPDGMALVALVAVEVARVLLLEGRDAARAGLGDTERHRGGVHLAGLVGAGEGVVARSVLSCLGEAELDGLHAVLAAVHLEKLVELLRRDVDGVHHTTDEVGAVRYLGLPIASTAPATCGRRRKGSRLEGLTARARDGENVLLAMLSMNLPERGSREEGEQAIGEVLCRHDTGIAA